MLTLFILSVSFQIIHRTAKVDNTEEWMTSNMDEMTGVDDADVAHVQEGSPIRTDGSMLMYWLDAYEDSWNSPGDIYLFGRALLPDGKSTTSCCVKVNGVERNVFVLPREYSRDDEEEPVGMKMVRSETACNATLCCAIYVVQRLVTPFCVAPERVHKFHDHFLCNVTLV
jgi:hypothetical protein